MGAQVCKNDALEQPKPFIIECAGAADMTHAATMEIRNFYSCAQHKAERHVNVLSKCSIGGSQPYQDRQ